MTYRGKPYTEPQRPVGDVIELFAGVGGFRVGLAAAKWRTVFSNQWEPSTKAQHASDVYEANFKKGLHSNEDVAIVAEQLRLDLKNKELVAIPDADLLVGGFPCQDYSVAKTLHTSHGLSGKKGVLWWQIHKLVDLKRPKFVFLENVDRLLKSPASQKGRDFAIMLKTLGDLGYSIEWRVVNAAEIGFPQRRIRVFIVAKRNDVLDKSWSDNAGKFLSKSSVLARAFPVATMTEVETRQLEGLPEDITQTFGIGAKKSFFLNAGRYRNGIIETAKVKVVPAAEVWTLKDVIEPDDAVPDSFWIDESKLGEWSYLKGSKNETRTHKASGTKYQYNEGQMAFPDLLENPSRTILTGEGGNSASRFKHIIETKRGHRRLMPVELERLNGFPDGWTQLDKEGREMSDVRRAFFMGNALVVGLIERVGEVLAKDLRDLKKAK